MRDYYHRPENKEKALAAVKRYRQTAKGKENARKVEAKRRAEHGKRMAKIKQDRGCERCGYNVNVKALQFHHRDPRTKKPGDLAAGRSWPSLERTIQQCDVLCANCHAIEHYDQDEPHNQPRAA